MAEYIKREAALNICQKEYEDCLKMHDYCGDSVAWNIGGAIKGLPAADVAPVVHGRWIKKHDNVRYWYECSECGRKPPYSEFYQEDHSRYCPNCGARMDLTEATT